MDKGLDTRFMIEICFKESKMILTRLEQGENLIELLTQSKQAYFQTLKTLAQALPLKQAIQCAHELETTGKENGKELIKNCTYPSLLFLLSYGMLCFFQSVILPAMQTLEVSESFLVLGVLKKVYTLIILALLIVGITIWAGLHLKNRKDISRYILLKYIPFLQKNASLQFSTALSALSGHGLSTSECFRILSHLHENSFVAWYARNILDSLQKGNDLEQSLQHCLLDFNLIRFYQIGTQTSSLKSLLQLYAQTCKKELKVTTRNISVFIQVFSYFSVGFVVLITYQILLMPMNILNSF